MNTYASIETYQNNNRPSDSLLPTHQASIMGSSHQMQTQKFMQMPSKISQMMNNETNMHLQSHSLL